MTPKLRTWAAGALASAMALAGLALAGPASAATSGGGDHLRPEIFTLRVSSSNPDGAVYAAGPVHGRGTDQQVSDNLDVFVFHQGSVNVYHKATTHNQPVINYRECTAVYFEAGKWTFKGGTGKYWDARGFGRYRLAQFAVLQRVHGGGKHGGGGQCDTNPNDQPKFFKVSVVGEGLASTGHGHGHG